MEVTWRAVFGVLQRFASDRPSDAASPAESPMKRLPRNPVRFEGFAALSRFAADRNSPLNDKDTHAAFLRAVHEELQSSLANDAFMYGQRNEAMFEVVVSALGKARLLKQEDAGRVMFAPTEDLAVPDYRIAMDGGVQLLVEVKNFHRERGSAPCVLKAAYLAQLERYAAVAGAELAVAVYWVRWNMWTMVPPTVFARRGADAVLELPRALEKNLMGRLGDFMLASAPPLRIRIEVDETDRRGDVRSLTILRVELFSQDRRVVGAAQRELAMFLIFNGPWEERTEIVEREGKATAVEYSYAPRDYDGRAGPRDCALVAPFSSLIARWFHDNAERDGRIASPEAARAAAIPTQDIITACLEAGSELPLAVLHVVERPPGSEQSRP